MPYSLEVRTAFEAEWPAALALIFQNSQGQDRDLRIRNALRLLKQGELDPQGLFVLVDRGKLLGSMVSTWVPGASGLVWPPLVSAGPWRIAGEDLLARHASAWLKGRGAKLAQALLAPEERHLAVPLERNGFTHITSLWYMRHGLEQQQVCSLNRSRLRFLPYEAKTLSLFHQTLLRTYEGALDCPEVNDVRTVDEIIAGHKAQGTFCPERWQLAMVGEEPVGILMMALLPESGHWDLSYVGVVPSARGQGFGKELVCKALADYRAALIPQLTLSVDARNEPAWKLYEALGFERYDERDVFLAIWQVSTAYPRAAHG
jgi:ribosomal protein S18 acetylase RimI-like enzyme